MRIEIELRGPAALFPSTSNGKQVGFRRGRGGVRRPFICHNPGSLARLEAITCLYCDAVRIASRGLPLPSFGDQLVTVLVILASPKARFDSHNYAKPIGDWLQAVGIIEDDARAEIFCVKAVDYVLDKTKTKIIIQSRSEIQPHTRAFLSAVEGS
ncbi:MAG: hypothetical protein E6Q97_00865 [Desulfurellales bacterium]|nr:MAG: hypothetical protein E6Q97_00865 [Desulfurellales bacterium]